MELIRPIINVLRQRKTRSLLAGKITQKLCVKNLSKQNQLDPQNHFSSYREHTSLNSHANVDVGTSLEKDTTKTRSLHPKKVLILHLPPNSEVEGLNDGQSSSAAIIPVDAFQNKEITKNILNGHTATANLTNLKAKRVIQMPVAIYEHKAEVDLAQSEDKEPSSSWKKRFNAADAQTLLTKNLISIQHNPNQKFHPDKMSISALEVEAQVDIPNINELVENFMQNKHNTNRSDANTEEEKRVSLQALMDGKPEHQANPSNDKSYPKGILALDFAAEVRGILSLNANGLNFDHLNDLKSEGFNHLLAAVTANVAGAAIAESCSQIESTARPALKDKDIRGAISVPTSQPEIKSIPELNNSANLAKDQSTPESEDISMEARLQMLSSVENNNDITRISFKKRTIVGELEEYQKLMHSNLLSSIRKKIKASEAKDMIQRRKSYLICLDDESCKTPDAKEKSVSKVDIKTESKFDCSKIPKGLKKKKCVRKIPDAKEKSVSKNIIKNQSKLDCSKVTKESEKNTSVRPESHSQFSNSSEKKDKGKLDKCAPDSKLDWSNFFKDSDKKDKESADKNSASKTNMERDSKIESTGFSKGPEMKISENLASKKQEKQERKINCGPLSKDSEKKILDSSVSKAQEKKEPKIDCTRFSKGPEKKICESSASKAQEKREPKIDCTRFSKGPEKKICESSASKAQEKKEPKIDCTRFSKGPEKKICESSASKAQEKREPKIDCTRFSKGPEKKICESSASKAQEKREPKIDCTRFSKGPEKKICESSASKAQEKKEPKIDCTRFSKGPEKKICESSASKAQEKKEPKIDCTRFSKGPEKKICESSASKAQEKKEPKIDCTRFSKGPEKKICESSASKAQEKKEPKIDCTRFSKGPEKKICESSASKAQEKKEPKIDCTRFSKGTEKKISENLASKTQEKQEAKLNCGPLSQDSEKKIFENSDKLSHKRTDSKINCGQFSKSSEKKDKSMPDKKMSEIDESNDRSVQTIRICLSKNVYIEITNVSMNKDIINQLQNSLSCSTPSWINSPKEDINDFVTVEIEGPLEMQVKNEKEPDNKLVSTRAPMPSPFKNGDKKCFSSAAYNLYKSRPKDNSKVVRENRLESRSADDVKSFYPRSTTLPVVAMSCCQKKETTRAGDPKKLGCNKAQDTRMNTVVKVFDRKQLCLGKLPMPEVGDCDALVKVHSVGVSGSDLHVYETGEKSMLNLGQEASGVVEQLGNYVKHLKIGDRVTVESCVPCEVCEYCREGKYNLCSETFFNGFLGKYSVHPADFCYKLPKEITLEEGALIPVIAQALQACYTAKISAKSNVVVMGSCPLALATVLCARALGAANICIVGSRRKNICLAKSFNVDNMILINEGMNACEIADVILKVHGQDKAPNVIIHCSACTKSLNVATMVLKPGGLSLIAGVESECASVNIFEMFRKEIAVTPSFGSVNMFPLAISLLSSCKIPVCQLISHKFKLQEVNEAFETALNDQKCGAVKVLVNM